MDAGRTEPSWTEVTWNTVRNSARRRLFATRTRTVVTALVACAAIMVGVFAYGSLQSAPGGGTDAATPGWRPAAEAATDSALAAGADVARRPVMDAMALAVEGKRLAAHRRLMLKPPARGQLISGRVDPRVVAALRLLLDRHMVQVTTFGERTPGSPLRALTIDCIDELPINPRSKETADVLVFFGELRPALAPRSVRVVMRGESTVIVATYPAATG